MAYIELGGWKNYPDTSSPIEAADLIYMEAGIKAGAATADAAASAIAAADLANTERLWHTRVGGVASGAISSTGTYPPHPITTQVLLYTNPAVVPTLDGNRVTGGGGMDVTRYPADTWVGP